MPARAAREIRSVTSPSLTTVPCAHRGAPQAPASALRYSEEGRAKTDGVGRTWVWITTRRRRPARSCIWRAPSFSASPTYGMRSLGHVAA